RRSAFRCGKARSCICLQHAAAITVPELFQAAQRIVATTYEPLILYIEAALIYLVLSSVLSQLQVRLERRFARYGGMLE
ncbi:hypothetical protein AB9E32_35075, partial [Rhizobium leguminosarum]